MSVLDMTMRELFTQYPAVSISVTVIISVCSYFFVKNFNKIFPEQGTPAESAALPQRQMNLPASDSGAVVAVISAAVAEYRKDN